MAEETTKKNKNGTEAPKISEPSENDPCIEFKNNSRKRQFFENTERRMREKTGLSRFGLYLACALLLLLIVLFITVVVLAATWPRQPHYYQYPICGDPVCLRASAQVQENWNSSISPCNDVWAWACSGWLSKHPLPLDRSIWNVREQLRRKEAERIRNLITTLPLPLHTGTVEWKLKYLYEGCLDVDAVDADKARPLMTIISELGGWYILRNWNMADFDPNVIIKQLHVKYGVTPYFKISVQPNPRAPGSNCITISPSGLGLPDRSYYYTSQGDPIQMAYKQLIRDIVIHLSVTQTDAERFGEDMFYYEKRIAEITPNSFDLLNPVTTYNPIKVSELKLTVASLPLHDILTAMFPESNITEETEVIVTSLDYLTKVSLTTATTDRAILNGYVIWTLVRKYLPYLSSKYTSTVGLFEAELLGVRRPLQRWESCTYLVKDFMDLAVESAFESQNPINNKTRNIVEDVFQEVRKAVQVRLKQHQISPQLNKYLFNKLSRLKIQIGLPNITDRENYIKQYYTKLRVLKANLFDNFKNGLIFKRKIEERLLTSPQSQDRLVSYTTNHLYRVSYSAALNMVVVPKIVLSESVFEDGFPSPIIYGRLGVEIAEAVISSIMPYESAWTADLKLLTPFHLIVNESHDTIDTAKKCLLTFINDHTLVIDNVAEFAALSTLKHISAVSVAHRALKTYLDGRPHIHYPSLEKLEDSPLFFLTYAQSQCSVSSGQQQHYDNTVNYELSQKSLLETIWWHIPEFANSVKCDSKNQCIDVF